MDLLFVGIHKYYEIAPFVQNNNPITLIINDLFIIFVDLKDLHPNYLDAQQQTQISHDGVGTVELFEIFGSDDFKSKCEFIDRLIIPPNSTVGYHKHDNNEELYIILSGTGTMKIDGQESRI